MSRPTHCPRCNRSCRHHTGSYCEDCGEPLFRDNIIIVDYATKQKSPIHYGIIPCPLELIDDLPGLKTYVEDELRKVTPAGSHLPSDIEDGFQKLRREFGIFYKPNPNKKPAPKTPWNPPVAGRQRKKK